MLYPYQPEQQILHRSAIPVEDDTEGSETESLFSLTPSLTKQLYQYRAERTFQSLNDYYFMPVDQGAHRIEELHILLIQTLFDGKLYREPVGQEGVIPRLLEDGGRVLDIGCGVIGAWTTGMAEEFPESQCIGLDLVPNEAQYAPPNCQFEVWDVTEGLPYPNDFFSVIHTGIISPFVPDFCALVGEMQRCLKPGGVLCLDECEATVHLLPHPVKFEFFTLIQQITNSGLRLPFATKPHSSIPFHEIPRVVADAPATDGLFGGAPAFEFVHELTLGIPIGPQSWMNPKEALLSSIKQKISLLLWDLLKLDPANQTGEAQRRLALLRQVTVEGGKSREEGPMCPYTSVWARKRG